MRMTRLGRFSGLLCVVVASAMLSTAAAQDDQAPPFKTTLQQMLAEGAHPYILNPDLSRDRATLQTFYERHDWQPVWSENNAPTPAALAVLRTLRGAEQYGLHSSDYEANQILYHLIDLFTTPDSQADLWAQFDLASDSRSAALHDPSALRQDRARSLPASISRWQRTALTAQHTGRIARNHRPGRPCSHASNLPMITIVC